MRELYKDAEKYLAIEKTSRDVFIQEQTLDLDAKREIQELKQTMAGLTKHYSDLNSDYKLARTENVELKNRLAKIELENTEFKQSLLKRMNDLQGMVDNLTGKTEKKS